MTTIELEIYDLVKSFSISYFLQENRTSKFITMQLKEAIGNLGANKGYAVSTSGFKNTFENEWLYDMIWYEKDEHNDLVNVELVLESELCYGITHIKYDFQKLLLAKANHKIMICLAGKTEIDKIIQELDSCVQKFKPLNTGEKFLVLIWDDYMTGNFFPFIIEKK